MRDYKAPDFKFRSLTLVFDANGQGSTTELNNNQNLRSSTAFGFSQNFNTIKSQRTTSAIFRGNFNLSNINADVDYSVRFWSYHNSQNRFYFKNQWFYGIHNQSDLRLLMVENTNDLNITLKPAFSIGHGRIEPIGFARVAMDVERLLIKGGRFKSNFSENNRTELANKIAVIQTKRFFDPRLGRIYQL